MSGRFIYKRCRKKRRKQYYTNFLKNIQKTLKPIGTIKFYLETLRNFKNQGDVKKSKEVNTKYCFRRKLEDYIADKGKKSGSDYLAHF